MQTRLSHGILYIIHSWHCNSKLTAKEQQSGRPLQNFDITVITLLLLNLRNTSTCETLLIKNLLSIGPWVTVIQYIHPGWHRSQGILQTWLDPEFHPQSVYVEIFGTFATKVPKIKFFGAKSLFGGIEGLSVKTENWGPLAHQIDHHHNRRYHDFH